MRLSASLPVAASGRSQFLKVTGLAVIALAIGACAAGSDASHHAGLLGGPGLILGGWSRHG